jgi:hypothetical protein
LLISNCHGNQCCFYEVHPYPMRRKGSYFIRLHTHTLSK